MRIESLYAFVARTGELDRDGKALCGVVKYCVWVQVSVFLWCHSQGLAGNQVSSTAESRAGIGRSDGCLPGSQLIR